MIARIPFFFASLRICLPVSSAETPLIDVNFRPSPLAFPGSAAISPRTSVATVGLASPFPWTMTLNAASGLAVAA